MFVCRKWKPFLLSGSYIAELMSGGLWIGPGFRLTSPDNNNGAYKSWCNFYILD